MSNLQSLNSNQCCGSQQTVGTLKLSALDPETWCREKPNPVSYADQSHSHLFTGIIITRSGDCIMINVQNISEKTNPRLQYSQQIWCTQIRAPRHYSHSHRQHLTMSYFTGRETGSSLGCVCLAAFQWLVTLLSAADRETAPPPARFGKCKRMLLGCKRTMPDTHTNTRPYNNSHTQSHRNTARTNRQERTHTNTHTVVTPASQWVAQWDRLCTMVLFEWGQTMELFGIWIEPDDECPRRLNRRLQPPTHSLLWPWQYASVRRLLLWTKISVISMEAATH